MGRSGGITHELLLPHVYVCVEVRGSSILIEKGETSLINPSSRVNYKQNRSECNDTSEGNQTLMSNRKRNPQK